MSSGDYLHTEAALVAAGNLRDIARIDLGPVDDVRRINLCKDLARVGIGGPLVEGVRAPAYDPDPLTKAGLKEFVDGGRCDPLLPRSVGRLWGVLERATELAVNERAVGALQRSPVTLETALMAKLFLGRSADGPEEHRLDMRTLREVFVGMHIANMVPRQIAARVHVAEHHFIDWAVDITNRRYPEEEPLVPKFGR